MPLKRADEWRSVRSVLQYNSGRGRGVTSRRAGDEVPQTACSGGWEGSGVRAVGLGGGVRQ